MRVVLAFYGTRGDVEPGIALGRELARRNHHVCMAVPPDLLGFAESAGLEAVAYGPDNQAWLESTFIPTVQKRGAAVLEARGLSSAASAANAAIDHVRDWFAGTPEGDWTSMAVPSDGSYGVPEGLLSSFPCTTEDGEWSIVQGVEHGEFAQERIDASVAELVEERDAVKELGLI